MEADDLVTVHTVKDPTLAEIIKLALHEEGIACEIGGESQAGLAGAFDIDLLVKAVDADRAKKIIESHDAT